MQERCLCSQGTVLPEVRRERFFKPRPQNEILPVSVRLRSNLRRARATKAFRFSPHGGPWWINLLRKPSPRKTRNRLCQKNSTKMTHLLNQRSMKSTRSWVSWIIRMETSTTWQVRWRPWANSWCFVAAAFEGSFKTFHSFRAAPPETEIGGNGRNIWHS